MIVRMLSVTGLILLLTACGSSSPSTPTPSSPSSGGGGGTPVTIVSGASILTTTAYAPNPISVGVGGSVTWANNASHTARANDGTWNSGNIAPGATFTRSFPTAGSFPYHCTLHPGMVGTVVVQ